MVPPSSETSSGSAPASSSACHGRSSSTCSTPSVASTATFIPLSSPAMGGGYPGVGRGTHRRTTVSGVPVRPGSELRRLLAGRLFGRAPAGPLVVGPAVADVVRVAGTLVDDGCEVALEHLPRPGESPAAALLALVRGVSAAG